MATGKDDTRQAVSENENLRPSRSRTEARSGSCARERKSRSRSRRRHRGQVQMPNIFRKKPIEEPEIPRDIVITRSDERGELRTEIDLDNIDDEHASHLTNEQLRQIRNEMEAEMVIYRKSQMLSGNRERSKPQKTNSFLQKAQHASRDLHQASAAGRLEKLPSDELKRVREDLVSNSINVRELRGGVVENQANVNSQRSQLASNAKKSLTRQELRDVREDVTRELISDLRLAPECCWDDQSLGVMSDHVVEARAALLADLVKYRGVYGEERKDRRRTTSGRRARSFKKVKNRLSTKELRQVREEVARELIVDLLTQSDPYSDDLSAVSEYERQYASPRREQRSWSRRRHAGLEELESASSDSKAKRAMSTKQSEGGIKKRGIFGFMKKKKQPNGNVAHSAHHRDEEIIAKMEAVKRSLEREEERRLLTQMQHPLDKREDRSVARREAADAGCEMNEVLLNRLCFIAGCR